MELVALIQALTIFEQVERAKIKIYTDSEYITNTFHKGWILSWQRKDWMTSQNQPVKNKELWQLILRLMEPHIVTLEWTKGHSTSRENNRVDQLASEAAKARRERFSRSTLH